MPPEIAPSSGWKALFYDWHGLNEQLFFLINRIQGNVYDTMMQAITLLGDRHNFLLYLAFTLTYVLITYWIRVKRGSGLTRHYIVMWFGIVLVMCLSFGTTALTVHGLKNYFSYPRPVAVFGATEIFSLEEIPAEKMDESFPSGHAAFITMIIASLWPGLSRNMRWTGIGLVTAVGWSRVAVGSHFPADVLAGIIVALILTCIIRWIAYAILRRYFELYC